MQRRRDTQRGSMMPLIAGAVLLLCVLAFGGITLWRVVVARQEAQRAADAAVLMATTIIKQEGLPFDAVKQTRAEALARQNTGMQLQFKWEPPVETPTRVDIVCTVTANVPAPAFIFKTGSIQVSGASRGTAPQTTVTEVEKKYPKLVLVLDFSGSMTRYPGDSGTHFMPKDDPKNSYHVLLKAVNMLLDFNFDIKYGLILFATHTINNATVDIALGNIEVVRTHVNADYPCPNPNGNPVCETASWEGLAAARDLFTSSPGDEKRYVLFVSDGQPGAGGTTVTQGIDKSKAEVEKLWNMKVTMFTIHIINTQSQVAALEAFMKGISGPPDDRGNPKYYANASSEDALKKQFKRFGAAIACQIGPITPKPPAGKKMHVFLKPASGDELMLLDAGLVKVLGENGLRPPTSGDLWDEDLIFHDKPYFLYEEAESILYVTPPICERVLKQHEPVVIRYASPLLTQ